MANIFFGILSNTHISNSIDKWISIAGAPDIFSERDDHVNKYKSKLLGKYDVVSIDEALNHYPDAAVWITYPQVGYVANMLLKKLPPERIHFLEADLEYRKGCKYLGNFYLYREDSFSPCCVTGHMPVVKVSGSVQQRMKQWQNYMEKLIDAIQCDSPNKCQKCHMLSYGFWRKSVKLNTLSFATTNKSDVCNFKCIYCFANNSLERLAHVTDSLSTYEMLQQLSEIHELNTEELTLLISNGEFCANKHCDEMLDIFLKTKWNMDLTSNCSIYKEKLANLMETGRVVSIVTSLDAGTRDTFKRIKQVDMFDKVLENFRKYPMNKTKLNTKYIFLEGINDNEKDVDGFCEIAKEFGSIIMFSSDLTKPYTEKMRELALRMVKKAKADGIKINASGNFLHPQDAIFIKESYANA